MKEKIARIVLLVLALICLGFGAWGNITYHNIGLLVMHMVVLAFLAYYLPMILFNKDLSLPIYTWEILVGFMAFFWIYLDIFSRNLLFPEGIYGIIFIDGMELMIAGLCFAIICIVDDNGKITNDIRKLQK